MGVTKLLTHQWGSEHTQVGLNSGENSKEAELQRTARVLGCKNPS